MQYIRVHFKWYLNNICIVSSLALNCGLCSVSILDRYKFVHTAT